MQRRADDAFRQSEFEEEAKKHLRARGEPTQGDALDRERTKVRRKFVSEALVDAGVERANHWGWPNIYTYTKSLGEQLIARSGVPYTLVRPACCESTVAFPFVGWNEGISTSAPIIYLIMKGQVQLPLGEVPLDLIPTDYVCAGMILALAELLEGRQKPVYQLAGADVNPCTVARFGELTGLYKRKYYQRKGTGNPIVDFFQAHIEPVAISEQRFDAWSSPAMAKIGREIARAMRKTAPALKPAADAIEGAAKREEKIAGILKLFAPFTAKQNGPFSCANVRAAHARLSDADRAKLPWAPESLDWPTWFHTVHMPAMEKYILPEMDKKLARETKGLAAHETLVSLLEEMAERHAHAPALTRLEKEEASRVTYLELRARSRAVAARLAAAGVKKGDRVVLSAKNHPDWAITYFGILRAGAVAVPLDPALDEEARANLIADCAATAVISDSGVPHSNAFNIRTITLTRRFPRPSVARHRRRRRREPPLHERNDRQAQGGQAHARELLCAHRVARAALPALREGSRPQRPAAAPHVRVHVRSSPAALARVARDVPRRAERAPPRRGAQRWEDHRDGRRPGALATPRAAHRQRNRVARRARVDACSTLAASSIGCSARSSGSTRGGSCSARCTRGSEASFAG